jgi:hypothetical protein
MACGDGTDDCNIPMITEPVYRVVESVEAALVILNGTLPEGDTLQGLYRLRAVPLSEEKTTITKMVEVKEQKTTYRKAVK